MKYILTILLAGLVAFSPAVFASKDATSKLTDVYVDSVGQRGDGNFFIHMSADFPTDCTTKNGIIVPSGHPNINQIVSLASIALTTGKPVYARVRGCTDDEYGYNIFTESVDSVLLLKRK